MSRPDPKNFSTFYSDKRGGPELRPPISSPPKPDGKKTKNSIQVRKKVDSKSGIYTAEFHELAVQEKDERFRYLLKHGQLRKIEKGGNIIFSQLPQIPDIWVCYRRPAERELNTEKINLDSLELNHMPLLEGEEKLKILTYQHNNITKMENLISLPNAVYLDLYDNSIRQIENLDPVRNLKVLLLPKNQILKIKNLSQMSKLEVLDLHANKLTKIQGLSNLVSLKVLNLSGNQIDKIGNLEHTIQLVQLNLKSNNITTIEHIKHLLKLDKLFLANNKIEIKNYESSELSRMVSLKELTLEGNPCAQKDGYKGVLNFLFSLKMLDGKPSKAKDEYKEPDVDGDHSDVLKLIMSQWKKEKERIIQLQKSNAPKKQILKSSCITGGHAEIEDETILFIFGNSYEAVLSDERYFDTVEKIKFQYMLFEFIVEPNIMAMLRKFKKLKSVEFKNNYVSSLLQVAKLESLATLRVINIDPSDNPVSKCSFLKEFVVYRFPLVSVVNRADIKQSDRTRAKNLFHNFDRMLQIPEKFYNPESLKQYPSQEPDAKRDRVYLKAFNKTINEVGDSEVRQVVETVIEKLKMKSQFQRLYEQALCQIIVNLAN